VKIELHEIRSNHEGFSYLADIAEKTERAAFSNIEINMKHTSWLDANMCAPFGAILYKASRSLNTVRLTNINSDVKKILSKNGFLSNYGIPIEHDTYGTTIEYKRFDPKDERYFTDYIERKLVGKGMPKMSEALSKKFRESIFEIFNNAVIHSKTEMGIFSCGQFFPKKHRLDFCIADLGIGIGQNIKERKNLELTDDDAILWALEGANTTKVGKIPGGLGLKLLQEFIRMNQGRIQIVSCKGYWELTNNVVTTKLFQSSFPGTVVNIEINTADTNSYCLASEIRVEDIF